MLHVKMTEVIRRSFSRTSQILFQPFSIKKWFRLLFIAFFAGQLLSSQSNWTNGTDRKDGSPATQTSAATAPSPSAASAPSATASSSASDSSLLVRQEGWKETLGRLFEKPWLVAGILAIALFFLAIALFFFWIAARYHFVWFHAVATNEPTIIEPYHRHRIQGNSLFKADILVACATVVIGVPVVGQFAYVLYRTGITQSGWQGIPAASWMLILGSLALVVIFGLAAALVWTVIDKFVTIVMAVEKLTFVPAFRKVWNTVLSSKKDLIFYFLWLILLGIGAVFLGLALLVVAVIAALLSGGLIFGLGYLLFAAVLKLKWLFAAYCVIVGIPFVAAILVVLMSIPLPFTTFFRCYAIEFWCALEGGGSYEQLERYRSGKSEGGSKAAVAVPIVASILLSSVLFAGIVSAIAIPNFIQARNEAREKVSAQSRITP